MNLTHILAATSLTAVLIGSSALMGGVAMANETDLDLEPCANGGVSASGAFASQAEEDAHKLALEAAVNGEVSTSGLYPTQAQEDDAQAL